MSARGWEAAYRLDEGLFAVQQRVADAQPRRGMEWEIIELRQGCPAEALDVRAEVWPVAWAGANADGEMSAVLHAGTGVRISRVGVNAYDTGDVDGEAGLLVDRARCGLAQGFPELASAAWQGPQVLGATQEKDAVAELHEGLNCDRDAVGYAAEKVVALSKSAHRLRPPGAHREWRTRRVCGVVARAPEGGASEARALGALR